MFARRSGVVRVHRGRKARRAATVGSAALLALALAPAVLVPNGGASGGDASPAALRTCAPRNVTMVEANVKTGMTGAQTRTDMVRVYASKPDFVALNEVHTRTDATLTPPGYAIWRTPGKYTGANAVTWRLDKWRTIARGTIYLTIQEGIPAGKKTELGIRYANWVQLRSMDMCQVISVVSYHVAPEGPETSHLITQSVDKLGELSAFLGADGPVILAGDLNRHLKARSYPRAQLASYDLTNTWDMTGRMLPTGDHRGATIDYIFLRNADQFRVQAQGTMELYSDHDAVVANLRLDNGIKVPALPRTFIRTHIQNATTIRSTSAAKSIQSRINEAINSAPRGSLIRVGTSRLADGETYLALLRAWVRGVTIQGVSTSGTMTPHEAGLRRWLGTSKSKPSWFVKRRANAATRMSPTSIVITRTANVTWFSATVDRPMDASMFLLPGRGMFYTDIDSFRTVQRAVLLQTL